MTEPTTSVGAYGRLLALYPAAFRDEYRDDLVALFAAQMAEESGGRVWCRAVRDLAVTVPTRHLEVHMNKPSPNAAAALMGIIAGVAALISVLIGRPLPMFVLLLVALVSGTVALWCWNANQAASGEPVIGGSWWRFLVAGAALFAVTFAGIAIPWPDAIDLGDNAYWLGLFAMMGGVVCVGAGVLLGLIQLAQGSRSGVSHH